MNKANAKFIKIFTIAAILIIGMIVLILFVLNLQTSAETSVNSGDNSLLTRRYQTAKDIVAIAKDMELLLAGQTTYFRNWKVVESKIENNSAVIKTEVPVVIFTDDLEVRLNLEPSKDFGSAGNEIIVNARSASRMGDSDFGENRRHIKQILKEIDSYFLSQ